MALPAISRLRAIPIVYYRSEKQTCLNLHTRLRTVEVQQSQRYAGLLAATKKKPAQTGFLRHSIVLTVHQSSEATSTNSQSGTTDFDICRKGKLRSEPIRLQRYVCNLSRGFRDNISLKFWVLNREQGNLHLPMTFVSLLFNSKKARGIPRTSEVHSLDLPSMVPYYKARPNP